jgi:hypothetical protein
MELCPFLRVHCFGPYINTLGSSISTLQVPLQCVSCSDGVNECRFKFHGPAAVMLPTALGI